jgi:hypothetical protein
MLKDALILEVIALPEDMPENDKEFLEDNGFSDIYNEPTFPIHFYNIDHLYSDERSTLNRPITIIVSSGEQYLVKYSKMELREMIKNCNK